MILRSLIPFALVAMLSTPALAFHCPADAAAIDDALAKVQLDNATRDQVIMLRDEGMALHNAGDHAGAVNKLSEAMRIILVKM